MNQQPPGCCLPVPFLYDDQSLLCYAEAHRRCFFRNWLLKGLRVHSKSGGLKRNGREQVVRLEHWYGRHEFEEGMAHYFFVADIPTPWQLEIASLSHVEQLAWESCKTERCIVMQSAGSSIDIGNSGDNCDRDRGLTGMRRTIRVDVDSWIQKIVFSVNRLTSKIWWLELKRWYCIWRTGASKTVSVRYNHPTGDWSSLQSASLPESPGVGTRFLTACTATRPTTTKNDISHRITVPKQCW